MLKVKNITETGKTEKIQYIGVFTPPSSEAILDINVKINKGPSKKYLNIKEIIIYKETPF